MKHLLSIVFISLFFTVSVLGQKIDIEFSHFANKPYFFSLWNGGKQDTVQTGVLDKSGKTVLKLPSKYGGFSGMARWGLTGVGWIDFVLNGEPYFAVVCSEAMPNNSTIVYLHSPENNFFEGQYQKQSAVINRAVAVSGVLQQYQPGDTLYPVFEKENSRLARLFESIQRTTADSPLLAARLRQLNDYFTFTGSSLNMSEDSLLAERKNFVENSLDLNVLYHSVWWNDLLDEFTGGFANSDSALVASSRKLIDRAKDTNVREALLQKLITIYNRHGKEYLLVNLGVENLVSEGRPAPMLTLKNKHIRPVNCLIVFYETGCNLCENELIQLRGNYSVLKERGMDVISIASDTDAAIQAETASKLPWHDNYCDFKGIEGANFVNYAVVKTPIIFAIDSEGTVTGRYESFAEWFKHNEQRVIEDN